MAKKIKKVKSKLKPENSSSDDESGCHDTSEYKFVYYPDLKQKYKQYANKTGELLLKGLNKQMAKILKRITEQMEEQKLDVKKTIDEGYYIYNEKPSQGVGKDKGITWSDEEYGHLGFQYMYLKVKSTKRFTEVYNMLVRAHNKNYFEKFKSMKSVDIVSIGGGPSYELYALRVFFKRFYKNIHITLTTIDLNNNWKVPNKIFDVQFVQGSFYDKDVINTIHKYDLSIMSYVMFHYFDKPKKSNLIINMMSGRMKMMLVNSRVKNIGTYDYIKRGKRGKRGNIKTYDLIAETDNRQVAVTTEDISSNLPDKKCKIPFLDVPF